MCAGSFLSIGLPLLLLSVTASYPQASPRGTERCGRGPASETWRVASLGVPSLSRSHTEPTVPCRQRRGPPKPPGTGHKAGTPIFGCPSSRPGHSREVCLSAGWVRSEAPAPPPLLLPLLCLKPFHFLRKADSKSRDVRLQLQVYYNGLLNQFVTL